MMWILIRRNQKEEIFKINIIVIIHSSFALTKLVTRGHVLLHGIKYNFNLIKHSMHGLFLDLKTNNYFDIILSLLFLVYKLNKMCFKNYLQSLILLQVIMSLIFWKRAYVMLDSSS